MVDAAFVECRRRNSQDISLLADKVIVPVSVEPGFQIVFVQVDLFAVADAEYEFIPGGQQVVIEDDGRFACRDFCQVILQPAIDVFFRVARLMVASRHGRDDIVDVAEVEGIVDRPVDTFKDLFPILPFYQVVVAEAVKHRAVHV